MSSRERTPDQEPPASTASAVAESPAAETKGDGRSFADRVGQKPRITAPDPFGIAMDKLAGVGLFESKQDRQMAIQFGGGRPEHKPSQEVIAKLKDAGYHWNADYKIWAHPVRSSFGMSTRIEAERLFQEVCMMIRQEKGIAAAPDIPF